MSNIIAEVEKLDLSNFEFKDYISASQIKGFECPTRWADSLINPSFYSNTGPTAFGDAIHVTIEQLSYLAVEKYDRFTGKLTDDEVFGTWKNILTKYPALVSLENFQRGIRQLTFWISEERKRNARIFVDFNGVPGIEMNFYCYLPNGVMVRGIIDRIEENDYTDSDTLELIDWKTGFLKDDHSKQMTLYKIAGNQNIDKSKKIKTRVCELEREYIENYIITSKDVEEYNNFVLILKQTIDNYAENIKHYIESGQIKELYEFLFRFANFNKWCYTCRLSSVCKTYISKIYGYIPGLENTDGMTDLEVVESLVAQHEHLKMIEKSVNKMAKNIDSRLIDYLSKNEGQEVELSDDYKLVLTNRTRRDVDGSIAIPIMIESKLSHLLSVSVSAYQEALREIPEDKLKVFESSISTIKGNDNWKFVKTSKKSKKD